MHSLTLLALTAGSAAAAPLDTLLQRAATGLNTAAVAAGRYFGTATDNPELGDTAYVAELNNTADFGIITVGNAQKWDTIESSRNTFNYAGGDQIVNMARANGQKVRCHTLVWHNQLPSWVSDGGFDNATLVKILQNHITNEVTHYKGQCYSWDVVNEAISDNGDGSWRTDVFYNTIGKAYIPIAFAAAAAADPSAKLYYNDFNIESAGAKSTAAQDIVKLVKSYGVKIDGVGFQGHFIGGATPNKADQVANMQAFTSLGVDVALTELDVRIALPVTAAEQTQQITDYTNTVAACYSVARCVGITIWDWTDLHTWVNATFPGYGSALPWDGNLNKKPALYNAIYSAEGGTGTPATSSAGPSPTTSKPTSSVPTTKATSTSKATSTTKRSSSTSAAASPSCAAKYGQCGGQGWTGPTCCASGSTCKSSGQYYSQCL